VRWGVSVVSEGGSATIAEARSATYVAAEEQALRHPVVQAVFAAFPEARITAIRTPEETRTEAALTALAEVDGEWDPFEE
jgi:DNA polymerase-3 subunit gamma/tau